MCYSGSLQARPIALLLSRGSLVRVQHGSSTTDSNLEASKIAQVTPRVTSGVIRVMTPRVLKRISSGINGEGNVTSAQLNFNRLAFLLALLEAQTVIVRVPQGCRDTLATSTRLR